MTPFLKQVAQHYFREAGSDLEDICFVFPNRRSLVFFRKYLCECVKGADSPVLAPEMLTVNEFFYKVTGADMTDRVTLLLELYDCYKDLNPNAESLDDFVFWGDVILGDFNDVDKYLVDPKQLFTNVADFKGIEDTFDYLTDNQREAMEKFVGHFRLGNGFNASNVNVSGSNAGSGSESGSGGVKKDAKLEFAKIWNLLYPLYVSYNEALEAKGMAYEGMVYRKLADSLDNKAVEDLLGAEAAQKYVFVGLNALNECEKKTLRKLKEASLAEFCWDYSGDMIKHPQNRSSYFLSENIKAFPQAFSIDPEGVKVPEISVISVPSSTGQAKQLPSILDSIPEEERGTDTAVILPDESLLMPILNTIPLYVKDINVTMGYPMSESAFFSFMDDLAVMQLHLRERNGNWLFYHKQVWSIFSSSVFKAAADEKSIELVSKIKQEAKYYIPQEDFEGTELLKTLFRPVVKDLASVDMIEKLATYQLDVVSFIAPSLKCNQAMALETEFAREYYKSVAFLKVKGLKVLPVTYLKLLRQLLGPVSVPFQGEPLKGLQIMGPLEVRALDFKNLVIMSSNEGVFPRRSFSSSFIPPELRKGFDLPTYEYQDAVWAYYFYRMICRAEKVWMVWDSRTEGLNSGEESRYIKQLRYHFGVSLKEYVAKAEVSAPVSEDEIVKTEEHVRIIREKCLSASSIQNYMSCSMKFYYSVVEKLEPDNDVLESMDASMIGTIYHDTMFSLYYSEELMASTEDFDKLQRDGRAPAGMEFVTLEYLEAWSKRQKDIRKRVMALICCKMNSLEVRGRDLVVANIIVKYVLKTIARDIEIMREKGVRKFRVLGLELKSFCEINGFKFIGFIDRVDSYEDGTARVVDYKTGKDNPEQLDIDDGNAETHRNDIFDEKGKKRAENKASLQFFIYDKMMKDSKEFSKLVLSNSMYSVSQMFSSAPESYPCNEAFYNMMERKLSELLDEIADLKVPFTRTEDEDTCRYCDFKMLCGR